jgi:1-acyl-sn-glycerol-3-phosphate acyltransferase
VALEKVRRRQSRLLAAASYGSAPRGRWQVRAGRSDGYVVVSNHQSNLDPMVHLRVLPPGLRVLAKREMFRIWPLGPAMRAAGMIEVDRDSPDYGQIDQAAARSLAAGHSLLVYPEGTTSPDGTIGQFKDGAFIIAVTSQAPVLPAPAGSGRRAGPLSTAARCTW